MIDNIKPKEATAIINSLIGGVVPKLGIQHITVGRSEEINAVVSANSKSLGVNYAKKMLLQWCKLHRGRLLVFKRIEMKNKKTHSIE